MRLHVGVIHVRLLALLNIVGVRDMHGCRRPSVKLPPTTR